RTQSVGVRLGLVVHALTVQVLLDIRRDLVREEPRHSSSRRAAAKDRLRHYRPAKRPTGVRAREVEIVHGQVHVAAAEGQEWAQPAAVKPGDASVAAIAGTVARVW